MFYSVDFPRSRLYSRLEEGTVCPFSSGLHSYTERTIELHSDRLYHELRFVG